MGHETGQGAVEADFEKRFEVRPGATVRLADVDPAATASVASHAEAQPALDRFTDRMRDLQYLLYADGRQSLLVVLQGLDAAGKDGTIRHVFSAMNPQGVSVSCFKEPSREELAHDFLWRVHARAPARGEVAIFNRSHYEDVLVVRVHELVPRAVWMARYDQINAFEELLTANGTTILKFYLHISPQEQLRRFAKRLDDPARRWKISEADYTERTRWSDYVAAYEDVFVRTSTKHAPWYVIPADHKWFRNLAIAAIINGALGRMGLTLPPTAVDLDAIRRKFHAAEREQAAGGPVAASDDASTRQS